MITEIANHRADIVALCQRFHVRRLDIFGSAARGTDFTPSSDIDLLVEFEPDHVPSLQGYFGFREALGALFGREIDLTMGAGLRNPYLRAAIERSRIPLYGA